MNGRKSNIKEMNGRKKEKERNRKREREGEKEITYPTSFEWPWAYRMSLSEKHQLLPLLLQKCHGVPSLVHPNVD
jgi:hypothetical protein